MNNRMTQSLHNSDQSTWGVWILVSFVSGFIALLSSLFVGLLLASSGIFIDNIVAAVIGRSPDDVGTVLVSMLLIGAISGAIGGSVAYWMVLRDRFSNARWWIGACLIAGGTLFSLWAFVVEKFLNGFGD